MASLLRAGVSLALGSGTEGDGMGGVFRRGPEGWEQGLKMANGGRICGTACLGRQN